MQDDCRQVDAQLHEAHQARMRAELQQETAEQDMADMEAAMQQKLQSMPPSLQQEYTSLQSEVRCTGVARQATNSGYFFGIPCIMPAHMMIQSRRWRSCVLRLPAWKHLRLHLARRHTL
jgi:5-formyltetrahydrofolate cyclo-ligase